MLFCLSDLTQILVSADRGDPAAAAELLPLVYEELRKLANQKMANEAECHTLQPTALVHEAWLRIAASDGTQWKHRGHFFAAAAEAMRRILIDHARRRKAVRHGGELKRVALDELNTPEHASQDTLMLVNDALELLAREDPTAAGVVNLRFFGGLNLGEVSSALGLSERTARRYWRFARAWLRHRLSTET